MKKNKMRSRVLAFLLCFSMLLSTGAVYAEPAGTAETVTESADGTKQSGNPDVTEAAGEEGNKVDLSDSSEAAEEVNKTDLSGASDAAEEGKEADSADTAETVADPVEGTDQTGTSETAEEEKGADQTDPSEAAEAQEADQEPAGEKSSGIPKMTAPSSILYEDEPGPAEEEDGWHTDEEGNQYYIENSERIRDTIRRIDGVWWSFDADGIATEYEGTIYQAGECSIPAGNHVWFYNMAGGAFNSDCIIVESNGRWGLIDTGNRYDDHITDSTGTEYYVPRKYPNGGTANLSCQISGRNGKDMAIWMIETLGVTHLDFIIGSHSHSDHIGGIPEIAELMLLDDTGVHSLIDQDTVFIHKKYRHVDEKNDDLGSVKSATSWHNQAFVYQAENAVREKGGTVVDISCDVVTGDVMNDKMTTIPDFLKVVTSISGVSSISSASYHAGVKSDWFDDYISFRFGGFTLRLYNLYSVKDPMDENPNSIAVLITDGKSTLFTSADLNVTYQIQQRVARAIAKDYSRIDVIKTGDHGVAYANSKEMLDLFQPKASITTNSRTDVTAQGTDNFNAGMYYSRKKYGTKYYEVGTSGKGILCSFEEDGITLSKVTGYGDLLTTGSAEGCINQSKIPNGWVKWSNGTGIGMYYLYFENNKPVTGWKYISGSCYYFDSEGFMKRGWVTVGSNTFYQKADGTRQTGWIKLNNKFYYFGSNGVMYTGWRKISGDWHHFTSTGEMEVGWIKDSGAFYYLDNGIMVTGWKRIGTKWYHFDAVGKMAVKWKQIGKKWYYFNSDGWMLTGVQQIGNQKYFFNNSGEMLTGWRKSGSAWYFFIPGSGAAQKGWKQISGVWYYFDPDGKMHTGWLKSGKYWYYFETSGAMAVGWSTINGKKYYFNPSGDMVTGTVKIGYRTYRFDASGALLY